MVAGNEVPFGELESRLRESRDEKVSLDETTLMSLTAAIERAAGDFSRNSDDVEKLESWTKLVSIVRDAGVDVDLRRPQNDYYRLKKSVRPVIAATAGNGSSAANRWLQHFDALGEKLSISPEARG
jgi:predicted GTPase